MIVCLRHACMPYLPARAIVARVEAGAVRPRRAFRAPTLLGTATAWQPSPPRARGRWGAPSMTAHGYRGTLRWRCG
jgi:hypothetical protein